MLTMMRLKEGVRAARSPGAVALVLYTVTWIAAARGADDEAFVFGMVGEFPGSAAIDIRLDVDTPLPLADLWSATETGDMVPLDLWILDAEGNRLPVEKARLRSPSQLPVPPVSPGHWRLERPAGGVWALSVPPTGEPWRLWSAFHPFLVSTKEGLRLRPRNGQATLFIGPGLQGPIAVTFRAREGDIEAILSDESGQRAADARSSGRPAVLRGDALKTRWRLDLEGKGTAEISLAGALPWVALLPWDYFPPGAPKISIEGDTTPAEGQLLELRAVVHDPDENVTGIAWTLEGGHVFEGERLQTRVEGFEPMLVTAIVRDRAGNEESATVEVRPPAPHERRMPGAVLVQAEDFTRQGLGEALVTDRGHNVGKMITNWHKSRHHWLEWRFAVPRAGEYLFYVRYASAGAPLRRMDLDGESPGKGYHNIVFPTTGGYGRSEQEWRIAKLGPPLRLSAGKHRMRLFNFRARAEDGMALDYVAIVPVSTR